MSFTTIAIPSVTEWGLRFSGEKIMRKVNALLTACILLGGIGCTNFSYLKKTPDGGIVQFKASDKNKVVEELKKQHGDIEVMEVSDATSVSPGMFDPKAAVKPSDRMMPEGNSMNSIFGKSDFGQMQLTYRKLAMPSATTPSGLPPAPGKDELQQTGFTSKSAYDRINNPMVSTTPKN